MKDYDYAKQIAEYIWAKCYKEDAPKWEPLPDLAGVLSQIDNMVYGMDRATLTKKSSGQEKSVIATCSKCGLEHYSHMAAANCCR